jgi:hypothetical protein
MTYSSLFAFRMMMTKGMLWSAFVTHSLETASPADLYYARHDGQQAYKVANPLLLENMTVGMQYKCKNMCFLAEDLKVLGLSLVFAASSPCWSPL